MTPADVRERFDVPGEYRASTTEDGMHVLELTPRDDAETTVRSARFEFHLGLLVAIRADLDPRDPWADGNGLAITASAVRHTVAAEDGSVRMTLIARDCPTHADEVRRLVSSS